MTYGDPDLIAWILANRVESDLAPTPPALCTACGLDPVQFSYDHAGLCRVCIATERAARKRAAAQRSRERRAGATRLSALDRRIASDYTDHVLKHRPCEYCNAAPYEHLEHRTPLSRGGTGHWWNLASACADCNLRKATKTEDEFKSIIRRERNWVS